MGNAKNTPQLKNEDYISVQIDRIDTILGSSNKDSGLAIKIINHINQLRDKNTPLEEIKSTIAAKTGLSVQDPKIDQIFFEIDEKPLLESYQPFNNELFKSILTQLKKE